VIRVGFTALRELTGMHDSGDVVSLSFSTTNLTAGRVVSRTEQKAIGGARETLRHNALRTWSVTTEPLQGATLDALLEFLASVDGGEEFNFEAWRQETGPSLDLDFITPRLRVAESVTVTLETEQTSLEEIIRQGTGGADDWYAVSFSVKEVP
jgi:hypothetical protein